MEAEVKMTPEERDRLVKVETKLESMDDWLRTIASDVGEIKKAAHMGSGAWWLLLRIGAVMVVIAGAFAWIFDRLPHKGAT